MSKKTMRMMLQQVMEDPGPPDAEKPTGKFPKKAILLSPHSNENPTTLPVMKRLAEKLSQRGIEVKQSHREGMMKRIWDVRSYIDSIKEGTGAHLPIDAIFDSIKEDTDAHLPINAISSLMSAEDILFRLDALSSAFDQNPEGTIVAEVHAMDADVFTSGYGAQYCLEEGFEKVPGAHALSMADPLWHFADALSFISSGYGYKEYHDADFSGFFEKLKNRFGMAMDTILEEAKGLLEKLTPHRRNIRLFEFPSFEEFLPQDHPARPILFKGPNTFRNISDFEITYGAYFRHDTCPEDSELEAVAEMFRAGE